MKKIDFTYSGGFPLTQGELDYLQQAYSECVSALAATGEYAGSPSVVSGMGITYPGGGVVAVTDGWFVYNGELIRFTGSLVTPTGTDVALVTISDLTTSLTYNDGGVHPAIVQRSATLTTGPAATTATSFPVSDARPFQYYFGLNGRESAWSSINVNTPSSQGSVAGDIYYKKNVLTNTLHIRAVLTANNALNFNPSPGALNYLMGTLPTGYVPATNAYFTAYYYGSNLFKDDMGIGWVKHLTTVINTAGQVHINFIKPDVSITGYTVTFNTIIPLD